MIQTGLGEDGSQAEPPALPAPLCALMDLSNLPQNIPRAGGFMTASQKYFCSSGCLWLKNTFSLNSAAAGLAHASLRDLEMSCPASSPWQPQTLPAPFGLHLSQPNSPLPSLFTSATIPQALDTLSSGLPLPEPHHRLWGQLPAKSPPCPVPVLQPGVASPAASPLLDAANQRPRLPLHQTPPAIQPLDRSACGLLPVQAEGCVSRTALGTLLTQQTKACSRLP